MRLHRDKRSSIALWVALTSVALASGCEDATGLDESVQGRWDAVGSLYLIAPGLSLFLEDGEPGTFSGTWIQDTNSNDVTDGTQIDGVLRFRLMGFQDGTHSFQGMLTHRYRMSGNLDVENLTGDAVFRRISFTVPE